MASKFEIEVQKEDMASDLEDEDDYLPDPKAWGKKKSSYYNADWVDPDFKGYKDEADEDQANYEEEEALAIQKRLLESMNEADLGIGMLVGDVEPRKETDVIQVPKDDEKLYLDVDSLSDLEKLELLKNDSPELEQMIKDFRSYLSDIKEKWEPLNEFIKSSSKLPNKTVCTFIETRYQLTFHFCINALFYFSLKSKRIAESHPIVKRLQNFKKLINEMDKIVSRKNCTIDNDLNVLIRKLKSSEKIDFVEAKQTKVKQKKKVKFSDELQSDWLEPENKVSDDENETDKRAITYEMSKNKGLTPKRKKQLRNPRVKHRLKFRKAKIRRKGQVREPRKELVRYGGELSGIKSGVVKSVRLK